MPAVTLNDDVRDHLDKLMRLIDLERRDMNESPEADAVRDSMEPRWYSMSKDEREFVRFVSYTVGFRLTPVGSVDFSDLLDEFNSVQRPSRALEIPKGSPMSKTHRMILNAGIIFTSSLLAAGRVMGQKGEAFQAIAHLFVGLLIGAGLAGKFDEKNISTYSFALVASGLLIVVELCCFIAGVIH